MRKINKSGLISISFLQQKCEILLFCQRAEKKLSWLELK
jgi:hypothetical protein